MPPDLPVLAFDTSAAHCAAALVSGDRVLAHRHEEMATGQAERLIPLLEELLEGAGLGWRALAAIGVGTGPGNFTGVRIGVATARGLALALRIPAHGVSGLEALAFGRARPCLASLDARQGRVYLQRFSGGQAEAPFLASPDALPEGLADDSLTVVGHRAEALSAGLGAKTATQPLPLAVAIACIAASRPCEGAPRPAPIYLRPADAAPPREAPPLILP